MAEAQTGLPLRAVLAFTRLMAPLGRGIVRRRLARGKEHPTRWQERLGKASAPRPDGPLIWLHAVGLGEVLALRGLILSLTAQRPDLNILVTSSALSSAQAFARHDLPRTTHQFLPLDLPGPVQRFLDHWAPDVAVWSEQDLWPRMAVTCHKRAIPQVLINGRMDGAARASREKAGSLYRDLYGRFERLLVQDDATAQELATLTGRADIQTAGSLKPAAPPLPVDDSRLKALQRALGDRPRWLAASTHPEDEAVALAAFETWRNDHPDGMLIIVPRLADRAGDIVGGCTQRQWNAQLASQGDPDARTDVLVADGFGDMGLWYRLAPVALIGGSFGPVQGHNPWEAIALGCGVIHGPNTANFQTDYAQLCEAEAAVVARDSPAVAKALTRGDWPEISKRATALRTAGDAAVTITRDTLLAVLR